MSVLGEPLLADCDTATTVQQLRQQAKQFEQLAAMAVTKNTAEMLAQKSREYAEQAARLEAKFITSRPIQ
jgi:hypothetical protein